MDSSLDKDKTKRVLIVEGESEALRSVSAALSNDYHLDKFPQINDALRYLQEEGEADIIFAELDMGENSSGIDFLRRCAEKNTTATRVLIATQESLEKALKAIREGQAHRYLIKPWHEDQLRFLVADVMELQHLRKSNKALTEGVLLQKEEFEELNNTLLEQVTDIAQRLASHKTQANDDSFKHELDGILLLLLRMIEIHNGDTIGSNQSCAQMAMNFAQFLKLAPEKVHNIYYSALLRNIGKVFLPDRIIRHPIHELSEYEKEQYARFPVLGQVALMMLEPFASAAVIIRNHMELFNGKGFPDRLAGQDIPLECRILRVVSDYTDLQRNNNILGVVLEELQARKYIQQMAADRYDIRVVKGFMTFLYDFGNHGMEESVEVSISDAKPGMRLAADALSPSGVVVLSQGVELTEHHLQKLQLLQKQMKDNALHLQVQSKHVSSK